jgi:hypothetical protein
MLCTGASECPNATWRSAAWIPLVGPWIAESLDGANGATFSAPAAVDAAIQDLGLLFAILGVAIGQDRGSVPLGDAPDAPQLSIGGSGLTLTF